MASSIVDPAETCTLAEFIDARDSDEITYRNFSIVEVIDSGLELIDHCLIDDYLSELKSVCVQVTDITHEEEIRYKYAPDLLAYDVYGYVQMDFIIMAINGVATPNDFDLSGTLLLPKKSVLTEFLSLMYNAESEYISLNRSANGLSE